MDKPINAENWMLVVDEVCCEYGPPEYRVTEDGEAWYWCFAGHDLPVADNLSELLVAAAQLSAHNLSAHEILCEIAEENPRPR